MIYLVEFDQKTVIGHQVKFSLEANRFDAFSFRVPILPGCRMDFLSVSLSLYLSVCLSVSMQPAWLSVALCVG